MMDIFAAIIIIIIIIMSSKKNKTYDTTMKLYTTTYDALLTLEDTAGHFLSVRSVKQHWEADDEV